MDIRVKRQTENNLKIINFIVRINIVKTIYYFNFYAFLTVKTCFEGKILYYIYDITIY